MVLLGGTSKKSVCEGRQHVTRSLPGYTGKIVWQVNEGEEQMGEWERVRSESESKRESVCENAGPSPGF